MMGIRIKVYSPERISFLGWYAPRGERLLGLWVLGFDEAALGNLGCGREITVCSAV
jgi:hypothetical protein